MRGTNQNMEKPTTPAGEEAETVDTVEEFSIRISTRITRITKIINFRDQNSEGKIPELQIQNATAVGGLDTTRISAAFVLRHSAHSAKYKATS